MTVTQKAIRELLGGSSEQGQALKHAYALLPTTRCRRRGLCCSLLPEMTLLEAVAAIRLLLDMTPDIRLKVSKRILRYYFLNPVEIGLCPFLNGQDCLIYQNRFFGCRTYGLWSRQYYQDQATLSREAKQLIHEQWLSLGISLPKSVVDFHLPYCQHVELEDDAAVKDEILLNVSDLIESLSSKLGSWHQTFRQGYFSDLSFLLASLQFGVGDALQLKLDTVRDVLATGDRRRIVEIVEELPDPCADLV